MLVQTRGSVNPAGITPLRTYTYYTISTSAAAAQTLIAYMFAMLSGNGIALRWRLYISTTFITTPKSPFAAY